MYRSCKPGHPTQLLQLPFSRSEDLYFVLVNPVFEAPTAEMRAVLPKEVPMKSMINNCCQGGSLVGRPTGRREGSSIPCLTPRVFIQLPCCCCCNKGDWNLDGGHPPHRGVARL
jgi:hypothetical protein